MKTRLIALLALSLFACGPAQPRSAQPMPGEDLTHDQVLEGQVARYLDLNTRALESAPESKLSSGATPWHLEYFLTDLSVTASGLLGALTGKGNPVASFIWRRQYEGQKGVTKDAASSNEPGPDISLSVSEGQDVSAELEPVIHSLVKSGYEEAPLREHLNKAAADFTRITRDLERTPGGEWWVSRYRMDVILDAQASIDAVLAAGGEMRLRFEWHRIMPTHAAAAKQRPPSDTESLVERLQSEASEAALGANELRKAGFEPYLMRVGVGYTEKGTLGIATAQGTLMGQIYFSRDVKKPVVHPSPKPELAKGVDFKKGLKHAFKIAGLFARGASHSSPGRHWKLFEIRASFDATLSGALGAATVSGIGSVEIDSYNMNF